MRDARSSAPRSTVIAAVLLLAVVAYAAWTERAAPAAGPAGTAASSSRPSPATAPSGTAASPAAADGASVVIRDQRITDESGRVVHEGDIDLGPVFARIAAGDRDPHRNDGTVFANREGRLPRAPRGYYTEWVVRTAGLRGVGPQRLITGQKGEAFYTPDHYQTFIQVRPPT